MGLRLYRAAVHEDWRGAGARAAGCHPIPGTLHSTPGLQVLGHLFTEREGTSACLSPPPFCCTSFLFIISGPYFPLLSSFLPSSVVRSKAGARVALICLPMPRTTHMQPPAHMLEPTQSQTHRLSCNKHSHSSGLMLSSNIQAIFRYI